MEVILLDKVGRLGAIGDKVSVKSGYGRNFLLPQGKAIAATAKNIADFEARRAGLEAAAAAKIAEATARAEKLAALQVTIAANAGDEGRLFGSVTTADIVAALAAQSGIILDRKKVVAQPIRTTGAHTAIVRLHADVECTVKLSVVAG